MNTVIRPISEINRQATHLLFKEMGVVETIRFLNQFSVGQGNYTKDREKWLDKISLDDAISRMKSGEKNLPNQKFYRSGSNHANYLLPRGIDRVNTA